MTLPHSCECRICGREMPEDLYRLQMVATQRVPCACVGGNCCLENLLPNTAMALAGSYCKKARELQEVEAERAVSNGGAI